MVCGVHVCVGVRACMYEYECGHVDAKVHTWRSKDNFWELLRFFHSLQGFWDSTHILRLGSKNLDHGGISAALQPTFCALVNLSTPLP